MTLKCVVLSTFSLFALQSTVQAQEYAYSKPSWWFGAAAGANFNFYRGSTQQLDANFRVPVAFHDGVGAGLYVAPLMEYHNPELHWGFGLQVAYDSRRSQYDQVFTPCDCPADLSTNLSYITIEPSLRLAPFKNGFHLFGGPRIAFNLEKDYTYQLGRNPNFPDQVASPEVEGELSNVNSTLLSFQVGAGFDIPLNSQDHQTQAVISPFVSFHPYIGQSPRSIETWNISTMRVGAALKFGRGRRNPSEPTGNISVPMPSPQVQFSVVSPQNIAVDRRVRETFPLRNYVFFEQGSTQIPDRYVMLRKNQVADFKEDQLEVFAPKSLSGRSRRGMTVYYNVLNIVGDRMGKNPSSTINLVGSSESGIDDARAMAESVKKYLVDIFAINASRITTEGRAKPKIPSEQPGSSTDIEMLRAGDRRVSIESSSPALLMEFQSGPNASLKPVEINDSQEAPLDSYVTINTTGSRAAYKSWMLEVIDDNGRVQNFGPYTSEQVRLPGKSILGTRAEGDYKMTMIGQTNSGETERKTTTKRLNLWKPSENEQGMRYSVIYEFDESKAINIYEKYLTEVVTPKIPMNATVLIHGYTDIIGEANYNETLSLARANDVKSILAKSLAKAGRKDVMLEVYGFGEDESLSPFDNRYPEERFYNRTVLIDIIPK
jgi:outer membrane protein OmpA-like peptidoglycan-associated protein